VDKPVLNAFRMLGLLGGERVEVSDPVALSTDEILAAGVRGKPDIRAIATRSDHGVEVLLWNYHDDDLGVTPASVELTIDGLPKQVTRTLLQHFRVDASHSNSFAAWKAMGSPQSPSPDQYRQLESAGQLQMLTSPKWTEVERATVRLSFELPRQGLSLVKVKW
jgi:xylan 1,4-beta-xylosidase